MQATTRLHDGIADPVLQEASLGFHHPVAFDPTNRMFETDADGRDHVIVRFLRWGEFTPTGRFLRLNARDLLTHKALEAHLLIELTPTGEGITSQLREAFVMFLAFHGVTQAANGPGLIDAQQVFDRVTLLLAAVVVLLVLGIDGAMDRSRSAIRPKRGGIGTPSVRVAASITASSSA
jgi:hypothetical protein